MIGRGSLADYVPLMASLGLVGYAYMTKKKVGLPIELSVCPSGVSKKQGENIEVTIYVVNNGAVNPGPVYIGWNLFDKDGNVVALNEEYVEKGLPPGWSTVSKTSGKIKEDAAIGTGKLHVYVVNKEGTINYAEIDCPIEIRSGIEIKITEIKVY